MGESHSLGFIKIYCDNEFTSSNSRVIQKIRTYTNISIHTKH